MSPPPPRPTPAAAVVALRGDAVLLIRRGRPPHEGRWSFPGGSVEPGETVRETAVREALEETGIAVEIVDVAGVVDVVVPATPEHPGFHYVITDFVAVPRTDAAPRPGDDAAEARWVPLADLDRYALTPAMGAVLDRALARRGRDAAPETATVRGVGEFGLIQRLARLVEDTKQGLRRGKVVVGVGDDAAVLAPPRGARIVATIDTLMEGVHFRRDWTSAGDLGWKSLAVNVSDAAAMGAEPWCALISLALPPEVPVDWVEELYRGVAACARRYRCAIVGGDTVGSRQGIAITVALLGVAMPSEIRLRSGARPGDRVCVTGTLGNSGAGLALLHAGYRPEVASPWEPLFRAHLRPEPPLEAARALAANPAVTAMMDLSDGLASDLRHICARSGAGARVRVVSLPISPAARAAAAALDRDPLEWALRGGEEYQLLFTLAPGSAAGAEDLLCEAAAVTVGEITASGYTLETADGRAQPLVPQGFDHFGRP